MVELEHRFAPFQGGKAGQWIKSPIGRAWAVGLLDGYGADAAAIRDAGLNYAERYWGYWPSATCVANYEGQDCRGRGWGDAKDGAGVWFCALDQAVRDAGAEARDAVHSLVVDCHWFPNDPPWLERLINAKLAPVKRATAGGLPIRGDAERLRAAIAGLLAIVAGTVTRAAA